MRNGRLTDEEMIVCAMAGAKEFESRTRGELASRVVEAVVDGDCNHLRAAAARILWELNRRNEHEDEFTKS